MRMAALGLRANTGFRRTPHTIGSPDPDGCCITCPEKEMIRHTCRDRSDEQGEKNG